MIDWKPEAIGAAWKCLATSDIPLVVTIDRSDLRAALDAAVKAQGGMFMSVEQFAEKMAEAHGVGQINGYEEARAEAFEEAAKALETWPTFDIWRSEAAAAIRALAKEPRK